VHGNRQQIEQVVINLVTNACQALRSKGGSVTVTTALDVEARAVLLEVFDDGVGIPPANLDRVTDPFFTTRQAEGGTGLGLAVTSRIVQNHGGSIRFVSNERQGTVVSVRLPVT
jgi:polar amino acid transport system substrate-binding protein